MVDGEEPGTRAGHSLAVAPALDALRSPWAFSWQVWAFLSALSILAIVAWMIPQPNVQLLPLVVSSVVGAAGMGAVFLLADRVFPAHRAQNPRRPVVVLVAWFLAFALRFLIFDFVNWTLVGTFSEGSITRMFVSAVSLTGWAWLATYYLTTRSELAKVTADLNGAVAKLTRSQTQQADDIAALGQELEVGVEATIIPALRSLERDLEALGDHPSRQDLTGLAESADVHARQLVRTVSHASSEQQVTKAHASAGLDNASTAPPFIERVRDEAPWRVSTTWGPAIVIASIVPSSLANGGLALVGVALAGFILWFVTLLVVARIGRRWAPDGVSRSLVAVLAALGLALIVSVPVQAWLIETTLGHLQPTVFVAFWILVCGAEILAMGLERGVAGRHLKNVRLATDLERIEQLTAQQQVATEALRRQVAEALHGPIQGRLAAIGMSLRVQAEDLDADEHVSVATTVSRCRSLLTLVNRDIAALQDLAFSEPESIDAWFRVLVGRWSGLIAVDFEAEPQVLSALDSDELAKRQACRFIEDAINNACSHGSARRVRIGLEAGDGEVWVLRVVDDGVGPSASFLPGLGLAGITSAGGTWSLRAREPRGAELVARIPLPA